MGRKKKKKEFIYHEKKKEGWRKFTRFYFRKGGFIDVWHGLENQTPNRSEYRMSKPPYRLKEFFRKNKDLRWNEGGKFAVGICKAYQDTHSADSFYNNYYNTDIDQLMAYKRYNYNYVLKALRKEDNE